MTVVDLFYQHTCKDRLNFGTLLLMLMQYLVTLYLFHCLPLPGQYTYDDP